jgi:methylated-DNA-[protein]-cysteine S-methyltransferase
MSSGALHHCLFETAFGVVAIVFNGNHSVRRIVLPGDARQATEKRIEPHSAAAPALPPVIRSLSRGIQAYFTGQPFDFSLAPLDFGNLTVLEQQVLHAASLVGYGQTKTYGEIAKQIDRPKAYRFVGNTLANNPFPVVIPCHRIIRADGSLGGFGGGTDLKERMLAMEHPVRRRQ